MEKENTFLAERDNHDAEMDCRIDNPLKTWEEFQAMLNVKAKVTIIWAKYNVLMDECVTMVYLVVALTGFCINSCSKAVLGSKGKVMTMVFHSHLTLLGRSYPRNLSS